MATGLGAWCDLCADGPACEAAGQRRPAYPACRRDLRGTPPARVEALLERLRCDAGADDSRVRALLAAVVERFAADGLRFSEILEPSLSHDGGAWLPLRFTYGFPAFREDPAGAVETIAAWCGHFGPALAGWARELLRPVQDRCVHHPLFGFAWDGPGAWRVKVYLEFEASEGERALGLASRLLGGPLDGLRREDRPLRIIGLDLGPGGIAAAKLYFEAPELELTRLPADLERQRLLAQLAEAGVRRLRDVLLVHRLRRPDDPGAASPSEVNTPLQRNELDWSLVRSLPAVAATLAPGDPLHRLGADFRLGVRNLTSSADGKLNVYYALAEGSPPAAR